MSGGPGWRTVEDRVLIERYPTGGVAACLPLLPGRSAQAIRRRARRRGLPAPPAPRDPNRGRSRVTHAVRRELARLAGRPVSWRRVKALAARWRVTPQSALSRIQRRGGWLRTVQPRWTRDQDALLRAHCDLPPARIARLLRARGVERTPKAVYVRLHLLGLTGRVDPGGYSAAELARLLGTSHSTVLAHIAAGRLPARRRQALEPAPHTGPQPWLIAPRDARDWLRADPQRLARARRHADALWLADLLGEIGQAPPAQMRRTRPDHRGLDEYHLAAGGRP